MMPEHVPPRGEPMDGQPRTSLQQGNCRTTFSVWSVTDLTQSYGTTDLIIFERHREVWAEDCFALGFWKTSGLRSAPCWSWGKGLYLRLLMRLPKSNAAATEASRLAAKRKWLRGWSCRRRTAKRKCAASRARRGHAREPKPCCRRDRVCWSARLWRCAPEQTASC